MQDDRTPHLNLPLPNYENDLTVDVERLRQALGGIDTRFAQLSALLESDDVTLDQVQELVSAIKQNRTSIAAVLLAKADKTDLAVLEEVQVLQDGQTDVDLVQLTSTAGCSVFVDGVRLNRTQWSTDPDLPRRIILARSYPEGHSVAVTRNSGGS